MINVQVYGILSSQNGLIPPTTCPIYCRAANTCATIQHNEICKARASLAATNDPKLSERSA